MPAHGLLTVRAVRSAATPDVAHQVIAGALPPIVVPLLRRDDFERVRLGLLGMDRLPETPSLTKVDWLGALAVFLLVFFSTFPIVIPFLFFRNVQLALRLSNLVALVMLFITGSWLARHAWKVWGRPPPALPQPRARPPSFAGLCGT